MWAELFRSGREEVIKMDLLLQALKELPEFRQLWIRPVPVRLPPRQAWRRSTGPCHCRTLRPGRPAPGGALPGRFGGQADAKRTESLLGQEPPVLPGRELNLYDAAAASRVWEQRRLRQLYDLGRGKTRLQIFSWESLSLRTMPRRTLFAAAFSLRLEMQADMEALLARLVSMGYSRTAMVEGPGQFALRGGILDLYSPAEDRPVRAEFFGDELDTMGYFDPVTQRRTENVEEITVLPVAEMQPGLHEGGRPVCSGIWKGCLPGKNGEEIETRT